MTTRCDAFIEPLDILALRGNKLFGEPGSWGESMMPPWPSAAAGALRSHLLVHDGIDLGTFASGQASHPAVGSRDQAGPFRLLSFRLARRRSDGHVEALMALPADLVVMGADDSDGSGVGMAHRWAISALQPHTPAAGIQASLALPLWPTLAQDQRGKPRAGMWLTSEAWQAYLDGRLPNAAHLVPSGELWKTDERVGVGLDAATGRADDGKLFSLQAIAMARDIGFAVRVQGALLPEGMLRLGGDGRGARLQPVPIHWPEPDFAAIAAAGRARLVLTSPAIFERGWLPTGCAEADVLDGATFDLHDVSARLVCAAVPRSQVVSGFDIARGTPKAAQRAVPTGAVYWLDELKATPDALRKLAEEGLWDGEPHNSSRHAEGFNRCTLAAWPNP